VSRSALQQAREVLLRGKKGKQAPEESKNGNERIKGHKIAGTPSPPPATAPIEPTKEYERNSTPTHPSPPAPPIEPTKEYEIIGGGALNTSRSSSATKKAPGASGDKQKKESKKKGFTFEEIATASRKLAKTYNLVVDEESALECKSWVESCSYIAVDTETKGETKDVAVNYLHGPIRLVQLHHEDTTWFVDGDVAEDGDVVVILEALRGKPLYFHNALFDIPRIERRFGVYLGREDIRDCLIASRIARAGEWIPQKGGTTKKKSHDLGAALERELGVEIKKDRTLRWGEPLSEDHLRYASDDVRYLHALYEILQRIIDKNGVRRAYEDTLLVLPVYLEAQIRGVPLDKERFESLLENLESKVEDRLSRLQELAPAHPDGGKWVWNNTNKNEEELGDKNKGRNGALRALKLAGAEVPDLKEKTLLDHTDKHPIVKALLEYRQKAGVYNKYKQWIAKYHEDGRIHPQAQLASLVTGRTPYTNPQIQNMDKRKHPEFRECIRADEGWKIVKADFSQQELRILAYFSGDEKLKTIFLRGEDPHLETGSKIAGRPITKDDPERDAAKRANFGFAFGGGVRSYRQTTLEDYGIVLTEEEGMRDQAAFREAWPGVYAWQKRFGSRHGSEADAWVTRSVRGRRRYVSRSRDRYGKFRPKYTDRLNGPVQSTGADILYRTLCRLDAEQRAGVFADVEILISSHDEIVLHAPQSSAPDVAEWLKGHMRVAMAELIGKELATKNECSDCVESYIGHSWSEKG
jgi:DNA polymerase I-like protein with 3'-5' exonuclease and polymerase domains